MMNGETQIQLNITDLDNALKFYENELALFKFEFDYGMGTVLLCHIKNEKFKLILHEGKPETLSYPLMSFYVENCYIEFERLQNFAFTSGGQLVSNSVFEYPLGRNIQVVDGDGHKILLYDKYVRLLKDV